MTQMSFRPWGNLKAYKDLNAVRLWLKRIGEAGEGIFKEGMEGPHSGRFYGSHQASAAGEYPASMTGGLKGSIFHRVSYLKVELGAKKRYASYLKHGTRKMAKRKMDDEALKSAINITPFRERWAGFKE